MNGLPEITRVHAFVVVDTDGTEGIPMVQLPGIGPAPMTCGDQPGAVAALERAAQMVADQLGKPVHHFVYSNRVLDKTIHPAEDTTELIPDAYYQSADAKFGYPPTEVRHP